MSSAIVLYITEEKSVQHGQRRTVTDAVWQISVKKWESEVSCRFGKMSVEDSSYIAKSQITNVVIKNSTVISENEGIPQKDIAVLLLEL